MGVIDTSWTCHICGRRRHTDFIDVAVHTHRNGYGIEHTEHVRYCNDSDTCKRNAKSRSHTERNLRLALDEKFDWQRRFREVEEKLLWARFLWGLAGLGLGLLLGHAIAT